MRLIFCCSFCLLIFLLGCSLNNPAPPFKVPTVNQIESIDIQTKREVLLTIQDKSKMAKILRFLEEHNEGWQYESPDQTIPVESYPYTAVFRETKDPRTRLIIWFGNRGIWISEGEFLSSNRFKSLSLEEEEELFDLIGIVSEKSK